MGAAPHLRHFHLARRHPSPGAAASPRLGARRCLQSPKLRQFLHHFFEPPHQIIVPFFFRSRPLTNETQRTSWFEHSSLNLIERRETLAVRRGLQFRQRDQLFAQAARVSLCHSR